MSNVYRKGAATATTPCTQNKSGLAAAFCHLALRDDIFSFDGYDMWSENMAAVCVVSGTDDSGHGPKFSQRTAILCKAYP